MKEELPTKIGPLSVLYDVDEGWFDFFEDAINTMKWVRVSL